MPTHARLLISGFAATALLGSGLVASQAFADGTGGKPYDIVLSGANEVNAAGAPINAHGDADHGSVHLTLNQGQGRICWTFGALTLTAAEALPHVAHIHRAPAGIAGPVVVDFFGTATTPPPPTAYPTATTCVSASKALVKDIRQNPENYYVNMHNAQHPGGVVRGQMG